MARATDIESQFFDAVARTAERLRGSRKPDWYLAARLDQILDDHGINHGRLRDDIMPRASFILRSYAHLPPADTACVVQKPARK
jgi:hypothetical protein